MEIFNLKRKIILATTSAYGVVIAKVKGLGVITKLI